MKLNARKCPVSLQKTVQVQFFVKESTGRFTNKHIDVRYHFIREKLKAGEDVRVDCEYFEEFCGTTLKKCHSENS
jgi:hypothetical protein